MRLVARPNARFEPFSVRSVRRGDRPLPLQTSHGTKPPPSANLPRKAPCAGLSAGRIGGGEKASPDTNSPVDCSCLASGRACGPARPARPGPVVRARTRARPLLARRGCLSGTSAASATSYAAGPRARASQRSRAPRARPPT